MSQIPAIGIDLGTTFSCVAHYNNVKAEVIADKCGDRLIPSFVYYDPISGEASVGKIAYELSTRCPTNGIWDIKRIIGRKFDDIFLKKYVEGKQTQFCIIKGKDDFAAFQITIGRKTVIKTPEEVSSEILKYLKNMASAFLDTTITEAVISIPAYFSNAQRKATKKAAELAGLTVLKLITEPTAGAIHYIKDRNINAKLLVFDWGGGTLDISLIEVNNKIFKVKAVYGDTLLGGRNIDEILFQHFYIPVSRSPQKFCRRLLHECIIVKEHLSVVPVFTKIMDYVDEDKDLTLSMTRDQFEKLTENIFQNIMNILEVGLYDAGWNITDIDNIVLVGGSTRIPKIYKILQTFFKIDRVKTDLNPDEAVASGACIQAMLLKNNTQLLEQYEITEVTPLSLGLKTKGNLFTMYIRKNSPLPTSAIGTFQTACNDQQSLLFEIFEGERKNCIHNSKLGEFRISGLPPRRAGDVQFSVKFTIDEDGILTIKATEEGCSKITNTLVVTMGEFRLSKHSIAMSLQEAQKLKCEDDVFEEFTKLKLDLESKCLHILYDIDKITAVDDRHFVERKCNEFLNDIKDLEFTEIDQLKGIFKEMCFSIIDICGIYGMLEIMN